jgi:hypothetical protein
VCSSARADRPQWAQIRRFRNLTSLSALGGKRTLRKLTIRPNLAAMIWVVRRLLVLFAASSAVCMIIVLVAATWLSESSSSLAAHDFTLAALFVLPFQAVGFAMLVPTALLLSGLSLPRPVYPMLLALVGAALGTVLVLPFSDAPSLLDLTLPATCGALSALVWFAFNRNAIRPQA